MLKRVDEFKVDPNKFLFRFVTAGTTLAHNFDPESKRQSMEWHHRVSNPLCEFHVDKVMTT